MNANLNVRLTKKGIEFFRTKNLHNPDNLPLGSLVGAGSRNTFYGWYNFPVGEIDEDGGVHFFWALNDDEVEVIE